MYFYFILSIFMEKLSNKPIFYFISEIEKIIKSFAYLLLNP